MLWKKQKLEKDLIYCWYLARVNVNQTLSANHIVKHIHIKTQHARALLAIICTWQLKHNYYYTGMYEAVVPISTCKWKGLITTYE